MIYGKPYQTKPTREVVCPGCDWGMEENIDSSDLSPCITCKRRFCADCLTLLGEERYCRDCASCAFVVPESEDRDGPRPEHVCGDDAIAACEECGRLTCADHLVQHPTETLCQFCVGLADVRKQRNLTAQEETRHAA